MGSRKSKAAREVDPEGSGKRAGWAEIDPRPSPTGFDPSALAMVVDEAFGGAGLVLLQSGAGLRKGDRCRVRVGELGPLLAEVRWREELGTRLARCGLQFLE